MDDIMLKQLIFTCFSEPTVTRLKNKNVYGYN